MFRTRVTHMRVWKLFGAVLSAGYFEFLENKSKYFNITSGKLFISIYNLVHV